MSTFGGKMNEAEKCPSAINHQQTLCVNKYEDILYKSHPVSKKHPRMSINDRAAQFAPFAALTGFEEATKETGRLTDNPVLLDENQIAELDDKIRYLLQKPEIKAEFTYFKADEKKEGGNYCKVTGGIVKADTLNGTILLDQGEMIEIDTITEIELAEKEEI